MAYENKRPQAVGFHPILCCTFCTLHHGPRPMLPWRQGGIENLHTQTGRIGPVGRTKRPSRKFGPCISTSPSGIFCSLISPISIDRREAVPDFFFLLPGLHSDNVVKSLHTRSRTVATGGPMLFLCCRPIKTNLGPSLNGPQSPRRLPMQGVRHTWPTYTRKFDLARLLERRLCHSCRKAAAAAVGASWRAYSTTRATANQAFVMSRAIRAVRLAGQVVNLLTSRSLSVLRVYSVFELSHDCNPVGAKAPCS